MYAQSIRQDTQVGIFTARAQKYIPCTRILLETETFKKAQYRLDANLEVCHAQGLA